VKRPPSKPVRNLTDFQPEAASPSWTHRLPDYIASIPPYVPGRPIEAVETEYGISGVVKLASNENPLGPSPKALEAIRRASKAVHRYPDGSGTALVVKLAQVFDLPEDRFLLGNGSDEIITLLTRAVLMPGDTAVMPKPAFLMYEIAVRSVGATPVEVPLKDFATDLEAMRNRITASTKMVFLNNPHNPTGSCIHRRDFDRFYEGLPEGILVVMDEAYIEFVRDPGCLNSLTYADAKPPVVILRTFSKAYGLAGLRIGYGILPAPLVEILNRIRAPFNTNSLAQIGAAAALADEDFLKKSVHLVHREIDFLSDAIRGLGLYVLSSQANYVMVNVQQSADAVFQRMLQKGVIVRSMTAYGYPEWIRVSVGLHSENVRFVETLGRCL